MMNSPKDTNASPSNANPSNANPTGNTPDNNQKNTLKQTFYSGFIAIIGRPNVGKSTLLNSLVGEKIAAVSPKPNTTRNRILGIRNVPHAQLIFLDTPGVHKHRGALNKAMARATMGALSQADIIVMMVDASRPLHPLDEYITGILSKPSVLVINKIDRVTKPSILKIMDWSRRFEGKFTDVVPTSALKGEGIGELIDVLAERLPEGPMFFEEDMITDQSERFIVAELIREKVFNLTQDEIPYKVAVVVEEFIERETGGRDGGLIDIRAEIYVERAGHKAILIGKGGSLLKRIGSLAREDIERILNSQVYLELWVKVKENWSSRENLIDEFVYRS